MEALGTIGLLWVWTVDLLWVWLPPTPIQCNSFCLLSFGACQFLLRLQNQVVLFDFPFICGKCKKQLLLNILPSIIYGCSRNLSLFCFFPVYLGLTKAQARPKLQSVTELQVKNQIVLQFHLILFFFFTHIFLSYRRQC